MAKTYEALSKTGHSIKQTERIDGSVFAMLNSDENAKEQLSGLEQQISLLKQKDNLSVINFVASHEKEGVSSIAINLAQLIAGKNSEKKVLLIDANLQRPAMHNAFNIAPSPGLRDALVDGADLSGFIHKVGSAGCLYVIPCGKSGVLPADAISHEKLTQLLFKLRGQYDYIFIDSPPILVSSNAIVLAHSSNITFFVVEAFKTLWEVAYRAKTMLEEKNCKIGGVILNRTRKVIPGRIYKKF
ncbi:MAG: hypothetical protein A2W05_06455 [Candidatus Schekmanbacteria bacterium RBG_16_38_10]|uniref:non-specific protein-tyrosine kinase n=1 Tax=Candidatus Schekmanbacteria bacterium RBG_16_38_10 TaxID=1817879 RepID=A0A1F7RTL5_9BACT|nr:MAG: hypothetical protein A2W05_06455 [Candidatus Schekmanbacteria bacterium RBG_16_38_10]